MKVTHTATFVAQATDYGAWGDVLREQRTDERKYRFGYQGQFAEKDEETGWDHFELREYDAVVGRWMVVDPMRQDWSPYLAMSNDPVNAIDPDGGTWKRRKGSFEGHKTPDTFWKRFANWFSGYSFLNKAYDFQLENPDVTMQYQYDAEGLLIGAGGILNFEGSFYDESSCEELCGVFSWQVSFGRFDWGPLMPSSGMDILPGPSMLGNVAGKGVQQVSGWIVRKAFSRLDPVVQSKFIAAIRKGIIGQGHVVNKTGIVILDRSEEMFHRGYTHKLKILGVGGDIRIFGKIQTNGHIIFDYVDGH